MLTEGKVKMFTYRVYFREGDEPQDIYLLAPSAQVAVDYVRADGDNIEVIEVAKVVNNWK